MHLHDRKWAWQPQIFRCTSHTSGWTPLSKSATDKMMTTDSPSIAQIILPHAGNNIDAKIEESELSFSSILTS